MLNTFNLSSCQNEIYYGQLLQNGTPIFNIGAKVIVKGYLDKEVFKKAVHELVKQHDSLRSILIVVDAVPYQSIIDKVDTVFAYEDFSPYEDPVKQADVFIENEFHKPFDIFNGELLNKYYLLKISDSFFYIFGKYHHLIADGWSTSLLFKRLSDNYRNILSNKEVDNYLSYSYLDFVSDDQNYIISSKYQEDAEYWKKKFERLFHPFFNRSEKSLEKADIIRSDRIENFIARDLYNRIIEFCDFHQVSVFHFFIGIVTYCFAPFYENETMVFGLPLLNRRTKHFKHTVGLFTSITPLKLILNSNQSFLKILYEIKSELRENFRYQRLPLSTITASITLKKEISTHPIYDVFLSYEKHDYSVPFSGYSTSVIPLSHHSEKAPLSVYIREFDELKDVKIDLDFNLLYFEYNDLILSFSNRFIKIIPELLLNPSQRVQDMDLLSEEEERLILHDFNKTDVDYSGNQTVLDLFFEQVSLHPDNTAVVFEDCTLSYRELDEQSNRLANYLTEHFHIGQHELIGIMLDRSEQMLIGILGILKCGGCYVPIDASHPPARISYIFEQSKLKTVLSEEKHQQWIEEKGYNCVIVSRDNPELLGSACQRLQSISENSSLMYVMYTSGTTGRPKGVEIEHRSVYNFLVSMQSKLEIKSSDRLLAVTTYSFDISVLELFLPLVSGATVYIASKEGTTDTRVLKESLDRSAISILQCTPAMWQMLLDADWKGNKDLLALCGGERLNKELAQHLIKKVGRLWNMYGPTETTIWSSMQLVEQKEDAESIGQPISNTQMYILNAFKRPLPVGIAGDLYIGGAGVARGYKDQAELTAERFIESPFKIGERLYRTGDIAKWHSDGRIIFIGRKDDQLKVRGYRVEPSEIEHTLLSHPLITSAVVVGTTISSDIFLVAYVVVRSPITATELREYMRSELPDYMVPSYYVELPVLPLSANGKIDKKSLPGIEESILLSTDSECIAATNDTELCLVKIWEEVLETKKISIRDNFFEIGGHSLRAIQILSRIYKEFAVQLSLKDLFTNPRIEDLGRILLTHEEKSGYKRIEPVAEEAYYELSHAQRRLWILSQYPGGSLAYNIAGAYIMKGPLHVINFQTALQDIIKRHESLRTVFITMDNRPVQRIKSAEDISFFIECIDLNEDGDGWGKAKEYIQKEQETEFNLATGPLLRGKLLKLEEEYLFLLTMHHIITDGWSMNVIVKELFALYEAYLNNGKSPLGELRIQYKDYAAWQNEQLKNKETDVHRKYWLSQFENGIPVLNLPTDEKRPDLITFNGNTKGYQIDINLREKLKTFTFSTNSTDFSVLFSAFQILLFKYTGADEFIVGLPVAGRENTELEYQIGCYINILPIKVRINNSQSFISLLNQIQKTILDAHKHQIYPFDLLVSDLNVARTKNRSPLFDVVVGMQPSISNFILLGSSLGLQIEVFDKTSRSSKYDLSINFENTNSAIDFQIEYNTNLFSEDTINAIAGHYLQLLNSIFLNPSQRVQDMDLLSEEEERLILHDFNKTDVDYSGNQTVLDLFFEQVSLHPDNTAVVFEDCTLSYRELDEQSNRLANYLTEHFHIGQHELIGIMLDRSEQMLIGILGILKCGGCYVPIDASHPPARISYIFEQSKLKTVLSEEKHQQWIEEKGYNCVIVSRDNPELLGSACQRLQSISENSSLMYVMYTSGTTGRPKGVEIEHRSVYNFLVSMQSKLEIKSSDRLLAVTTYSFDISVLELFLPLVSGATVYIASKEGTTDTRVLKESLDRSAISILQCTPAMWQMLLDADWKGNKDLLALCGGERLNKELAQHLIKKVGRLWNMYGPTETTIWSSMQLVEQKEDAESIGQPISNTQMYILNAFKRPLPVGIAGDLYIGGAGVARGYKDQAELTAERFIESPFKIGERLYRTGDIAKWHSDGRIIFIGRKDDQLKVRGYRVEPSEIEHTLLSHPLITSAVVVGTTISSDIFLVAYVVVRSPITATELREYMRSELPDYMVPSYYVELPVLPLSANGKIDKKSLPGIEESILLSTDSECIAATNDTELCLVKIWEEVLETKKISIRDNFFEIGGHSLRAIQILSRIYKEFAVQLSLKDLFTNPRIEDLGRILLTHEEKSGYKRIEPVAEEAYYELSHAQRRLWILSQYPGGSLAYNIAGAYIMKGPLHVINFQTALQDIIKRHESLRTVFITMDNRPVQRIKSAEDISFFIECIDLNEDGDGWGKAKEYIQKEQETEFNLATGPLLRGKLLKLEEEYLFLLTMHHIITDGWSMNVIVKELFALYEAYLNNGKSPLGELRIQYKDYAAWQNEQLKNKETDVHRKYWLSQFENGIPVLNLPTDEKRPDLITFNGKRIQSVINREVYLQIYTLIGKYNISLYSILMGLVNILLYRYTGQSSLITGYPVTLRSTYELEEQVGMFLNTLPLCIAIKDDEAPISVIEQVSEKMAEAHKHQIYPFDLLVSDLNVARTKNRSPLFDVVVVLQNMNINQAEVNKMTNICIQEYYNEDILTTIDLRWEFIQRRDSIVVNIEYNSRLFKKETILSLNRLFSGLLHHFLENPEMPISDISLNKDKNTELKSTQNEYFNIHF